MLLLLGLEIFFYYYYFFCVFLFLFQKSAFINMMLFSHPFVSTSGNGYLIDAPETTLKATDLYIFKS